MRRAFLAAVVAASGLLAAPAFANGRFPASNAIVFSPTNPDLVILRATYGVMLSYDYGKTWTWLCEDALGLPPTANEDPSIGITANESVVVGISKGLEVSTDTGCDWTFETQPGLGGQLIKDLVVRPDTPHTILVVTSTEQQDADAGDAGNLYAQQVFISTNDGATWAPLGAPIDPTAIVTTIEVAASDPQRLYVSTFRNVTPRTASVFVSTNAGTTWTEYPTPALNQLTETSVYIAAVDPNNADLVYARSEGSSRLFVSSDGAHTWQVAFSLDDEMLGFALSQDGSTVYLGGANSGLFMAPSSTLQFQQISSIDVECLATHGADLWACSDEKSGFIGGVSHDDGATFTSTLQLNGISGPIVCAAADATASQCVGAAYQSMCANLGGCLVADAGAEGGVVEAGTGRGSATARSSCGCAVVGGGSAAGALCATLVGLLALRRRNRT